LKKRKLHFQRLGPRNKKRGGDRTKKHVIFKERTERDNGGEPEKF